MVISFPVEQLESMQDMLLKGSGSPTIAAWACGCVYAAIGGAIKKGEMENEDKTGV